MIPESEIKFSFSRSGGAGGQNVNKVETKATLYWNFRNSKTLNDFQKELVASRLKNRTNEKGEIVIHSQTERSQFQNKKKAIEILNNLVKKALIIQRPRKKTKMPKSAKEKILKTKKIISDKKRFRKKPLIDL